MRRIALLAPLVLAAATLLPLGCGGQDDAPRVPKTAEVDATGRFVGPVKPGRTPPNVLLIVLDTLRVDAVRPLGESPAMPFLSGLARRHTWFRRACSTSSWTLPALASMLTGLEPQQHGLVRDEAVFQGTASLALLPEILRANAGYSTAGWFGGLGPAHHQALAQGLDVSGDDFLVSAAERTLRAWEASRPADKPWFLLLHTYEAHDPYGAENHGVEPLLPGPADHQSLLALGPDPPVEELTRRVLLDARQRALVLGTPLMRAQGEAVVRYTWEGLRQNPASTLPDTLRAAYLGGVRALDDALAALFERLRASGLLDNTVWIVTSDHGEAFGEHGTLLHGRQLYDELVRVPLIVGGPPPFDRPRACLGSVSLLDVLPTICEVVGLPVPAGARGRSLVDPAACADLTRAAPCEVLCTPQATGGAADAARVGVRNARWKYVASLDLLGGGLEEEAYDLDQDPLEQTDLLASGARLESVSWGADFARAAARAREQLGATAAERLRRGTPVAEPQDPPR